MAFEFRKALVTEQSRIWEILEQAIIRRKEDGSKQWQDGYPNPDVVRKDIETGVGFVLIEDSTIIGYAAVLINDEPSYADIEGEWLSNEDFVVVHRVAVAQNHLGKGLSGKILEYIEEYAASENIYSVKVDTNFDNIAMMKILEKRGYIYCGEVYFRGSPRRAYEKMWS
ncbi:GNAT family N-acetyltransferase [Chitinophaga filiformis]|uniref:Acetyltransferase (GNAT) family protein n=1 Tax=Chitinophaga filiformis TaxID=104663 RepID=A0A1G7SJG0_CHIFI|nr:GNAT family N-acetyltransferase [Chitinophaga filiformis]SDG23032.1 Acetyltransferase (GNAT) family protein [Chitinophaga filiformis]